MPPPTPPQGEKPAVLRRIAVVTTGRADYGILKPVLGALDARADTAPSLLVTGAHLSPGHGMTIDQIRADGWPISSVIHSEQAPGAEPSGVGLPTATKLARAAAGFAEAFHRLMPDVCVLLGDRFETLAAAVSASASGVPIAHIHGGEVSLGSLDNQFRYAISALASLHCTATERSRARLIAMGENEHLVTRTGAPGLDHLARFEPLPRDAFCDKVGLPSEEAFLLVTLHPETSVGSDSEPQDETDEADKAALKVGAALTEIGMPCLITASNQDKGGDTINARFRSLCERMGWPFRDALGSSLYRNAMHHAQAMVGNSSSGIIEAASFGLPVVNLGNRQLGRERSGNVVDAGLDKGEIILAIETARATKGTTWDNIYAADGAGERIARAIAEMPLEPSALQKSFAPPGF